MAKKKAGSKKTAGKKPAPKKPNAAKQPGAAKTGGSAGNRETAGQPVVVFTAQHPPRTDSPEYIDSRKWLMGKTPGGCYICGGPVDLSHPADPGNSVDLHLEDHHGGGIYHNSALVAFNTFPLEWSMGFGANPAKIAAFVQQLNAAGLCNYTAAIKTTDDVMKWVDSQSNANVKLCKPHHVGVQDKHTPDANGHEAVGIHNAPWPVLAAQATCDWDRFDMFAGTTGVVAVAPDPTNKGGVVVVHQHSATPEVKHYAAAYVAAGKKPPKQAPKFEIGDRIDKDHPLAIAAHRGYRQREPVATAMKKLGIHEWQPTDELHGFKRKD